MLVGKSCCFLIGEDLQLIYNVSHVGMQCIVRSVIWVSHCISQEIEGYVMVADLCRQCPGPVRPVELKISFIVELVHND